MRPVNDFPGDGLAVPFVSLKYKSVIGSRVTSIDWQCVDDLE